MSSPSEDARITVNPPAPATPKCLIKVRYPRSVAGVIGLVLNRNVVQLHTHHIDGRTWPHFTPKERCEGCQKRFRLQLKVYVGCYDTRSKLPFVAMGTDATLRAMPDLAREADNDNRGRYIRLWKADDSVVAPTHGEWLEGRESSLLIPDPIPIRRILEDMWRLPEGILGEEEG